MHGMRGSTRGGRVAEGNLSFFFRCPDCGHEHPFDVSPVDFHWLDGLSEGELPPVGDVDANQDAPSEQLGPDHRVAVLTAEGEYYEEIHRKEA